MSEAIYNTTFITILDYIYALPHRKDQTIIFRNLTTFFIYQILFFMSSDDSISLFKRSDYLNVYPILKK